MKKKDRFTNLPSQLVNDVKSLQLTQNDYNNCIRLIDLLKYKSYRKNQNYDSFVQLPKAYLTKVFSHKYHKFLTPLKEAGILVPYLNQDGAPIYSSKLNFGKSYRIESKYFINDDELEFITYKSDYEDYEEIDSEECNYQELVSKDLKVLEYDIKKLRKIANEKINNLSIEDYATGKFITNQYFAVTVKTRTSQYKHHMNLVTAIAKAEELNLTLIQDKTRFYITDAKDFIKMKKNVFRDAYLGAIEKLEKKLFYADRNQTNFRLDSNVTNLCGDLMNQIIKDNDLIQFDLANSQFAILCHILKQKDGIKESKDFLMFKAWSESGELYTHIQNFLSLDSRKDAKIMMFELLFSSQNNRSANKTKLKRILPNLIEWIDDFKKKNGYENFAIMLQQEESKIFIDHIWKDFKEAGKFCLTKHDSIIVKSEDAAYAEQYLTEYFNSINFITKICN